MANETKTSDWICIATSGATADRREIDEQWLIDAAESYSRNTYSALIWPNHDTDYRHWDCNLGEVEEIKIESTEDGKKKLFARITANQFLLELNELGQKLYTSIELEPNFANTGKDYLLGLCVTDTPASLGTTRLKFSKDGEEKIIKRGSVEAFSLSFSESESSEIKKTENKPSLFNRIFSGRNAENNQRKPLRVFSAESESNSAQNQEEEPMNEELKQLLEAINKRLEALEAASTGASSASTPDEAAEEVAAAAEEVAELAAEVIELADEIAEAPEDEVLQENFSKTKSSLEDALKAYSKLTKKNKRYSSQKSSRETRELRREIRGLREEVKSGGREFTRTPKPDGAPATKVFKFA